MCSVLVLCVISCRVVPTVANIEHLQQRLLPTARSACDAGTGIETNINGRFKLTLHKQATLAPKLQDLDFALLENANEYVVHGLTVKVAATPLSLLACCL